jgi:hypothetical protein
MVICISAAEEHMRPFLVSSQATSAIETQLKQVGFRIGVDLILKRRSKPYMSSELFAEYISTIVLLYIEELRSNCEFADRDAILLMDNYSIHTRAETLQKLADSRVKVITFPPHTTHIFPNLDLNLFGVFKKR